MSETLRPAEAGKLHVFRIDAAIDAMRRALTAVSAFHHAAEWVCILWKLTGN